MPCTNPTWSLTSVQLLDLVRGYLFYMRSEGMRIHDNYAVIREELTYAKKWKKGMQKYYSNAVRYIDQHLSTLAGRNADNGIIARVLRDMGVIGGQRHACCCEICNSTDFEGLGLA